MSASANKEQVAIVTGASSGMGLSITGALLERGYRVAANARTITKSQELKPSAALLLVDALFYLQSAPMVNGENIRIDGGAHAGAKW